MSERLEEMLRIARAVTKDPRTCRTLRQQKAKLAALTRNEAKGT